VAAVTYYRDICVRYWLHFLTESGHAEGVSGFLSKPTMKSKSVPFRKAKAD
jgi:hypothetical protein